MSVGDSVPDTTLIWNGIAVNRFTRTKHGSFSRPSTQLRSGLVCTN